MFSYQVPQSSLCHENVPFVSGRISKVDYLFLVWQYIKSEVLLSTLQTAALTLHPSLVLARYLHQLQGRPEGGCLPGESDDFLSRCSSGKQ